MKYIDEFRNKSLIKKLGDKINALAPSRKINLMEVCGTHTQNFFRFGLDELLPGRVSLISGPGCPVCVSSAEYIDQAILYARNKDFIVLTFGDMLRLPGSRSTLEKAGAEFGNVRMVYSAQDALRLAKLNPRKRIIFLAVGFETTAPTVALSVMQAQKGKLENLFFFTALKLIPPAMDYLLRDKRLNLDGFLCPGHVSAIIGSRPYEFIPKTYGRGCCITGFEPLDILEGIYLLLRQIAEKKPVVANQYIRVVNKEGNPRARRILSRVFKVSDTCWRGLGKIPKSGLELKAGFSQFDIAKIMPLEIKSASRPPAQPSRQCRCADVLKGLIKPDECLLFRKACSPEHPLGPCMISVEGACNAYYKYR
ncbi:MAG: hydrogenase formation protein HypD [Candidatus Omnitrophota bacterium]|jgi:hydrogenase expression/formation protein HypD